MSGRTHRRPTETRIDLADAADLVGRRFHEGAWTSDDPQMLAYQDGDAPNAEARDRAAHVERLLTDYITSGRVTAYMSTDDALTDVPTHWVTDSSFALCIRTGCFRVWSDQWDTLLVDRSDLMAALAPTGVPRKKHSFEWKPLVHEAWKFALSQPALPTKAAVIEHLGDWSSLQEFDPPEASALADVAKEIVDFLGERRSRELLKSGSLEAPADQSE